jgi:surface antigen
MRNVTIIATTLALSLSACAVPDGVGGYGTKSVVGGLGGAAAGGLLGSQFGRGSGNLAMTGLGVLAGALAGSAVGQSLDRADQAALERNTHATLTSQPIGQPIAWSNPQNGNQVVVTPTREGYSGDAYCREFQQTVIVGGRKQQGYGHACRQPDHSWKIVE